MSVEALYAIQKSVHVPVAPEQAWDVFTRRAADWWPLGRHSIGGGRTTFAEFTSERVYERWDDGTERAWGHMRVWEPPRRMVFSWEISEDSGDEIEVTFTAEGDGTRVDLEHRGWETGTRAMWDSYDHGWDHVLGCFGSAA